MNLENMDFKQIEVEPIETENRFIKGRLPCDNSIKYLEDVMKYESRSTQGQFPLLWASASGHSIYDLSGNKWIDFTSTAFVMNIGHNDERFVNDLKNALDEGPLHTYSFVNKSRAEFVKEFINSIPKQFEKVFLLSSGSESTDAALKLIRLNGLKKNKKPYVITFKGNWHGRTMGSQFLTDNEYQKKWIGHQDPYIIHLDFPYEWDLKNTTGEKFALKQLDKLKEMKIDIASDVSGIFFETFQGWGACFYPKDFVSIIINECKKNDVITCFDEMQSGFGRTGKMFGYMHYDVEPDMLCFGKAIGGGFPLSGVTSSQEIMDLPNVGEMSSTHSGNPLSCRAGLNVLRIFKEDKLIEMSAIKGKILFEELNRLKDKYPKYIAYVNGYGLLAALIFKHNDQFSTELCSKVTFNCYKKGLLVVNTKRESIKISPPIVISIEAIKEAVGIIEEALLEAIEQL